MKKTFFILFLLLNFNLIFAQKNFYGAGVSYALTGEFGDEAVGLTGLSLNYERRFAKKWSFSIVAIGQKSKAIDDNVGDFTSSSNVSLFDIKTTHRLLGLENLYVYHPSGLESGFHYGFGFNIKLYNSVNTAVTPNTPAYILYGTANIDKNILLSVGYTEYFDSGFCFSPFANLAFDPVSNNIFPMEFRLGCNFTFGNLFFENLKNKE